MKCLFALAAAFVTVLGTARSGLCQDKPPVQSPVRPEVIVKFSANSEAGGWVKQAASQNPPSDPKLNAHVKALGQQVGVPLELRQIGSGGNVVVAVRQDDLVKELVRELQSNPNVKAVRQADAPGRASPVVEVDFIPGRPEADAVARVASSGHDTGPELSSITDKVGKEAGGSWVGRIKSSNQLQLTLDVGTTTQDVAKRLAKCPGVEYAQPNAMRQPKIKAVDR